MKKSLLFLTSLSSLALFASPAAASDFNRHNVSTTGLASDVRPIMSFDSKSCLPIAATDQAGTQNGGLKSSGSPGGSCRSADKTQAYVRWACKKHGQSSYCGILYAFYFEKDQPSTSPLGGHRHDWEHVIMWTKDKVPQFMTISDHRGVREFDLKYSHPGDKWNSNLRNTSGKRYNVRYWRTDGSVSTNSFDAITTSDKDFPGEYVHYTNWDQLNSKQKAALAGNWASAVSRIGDNNFAKYLRDHKPADTEFRAVN